MDGKGNAMYIGLIPENPLFEGEHMTLVWMGHVHDPLKIRLAEDIAQTVTDWLIEEPSLFWLHEYSDLDGHSEQPVRVGTVTGTRMPRMQLYRQACQTLGLNASEYSTWEPHITSSPQDGYNFGYIERKLHMPFKFARCLVLK